jgi:hypothetical protein
MFEKTVRVDYFFNKQNFELLLGVFRRFLSFAYRPGTSVFGLIVMIHHRYAYKILINVGYSEKHNGIAKNLMS